MFRIECFQKDNKLLEKNWIKSYDSMTAWCWWQITNRERGITSCPKSHGGSGKPAENHGPRKMKWTRKNNAKGESSGWMVSVLQNR